ncbi:non-ribosomal peptide synthetase [Candidatus Enterococcus murrayae]|uniref:Amino acid adenylation domain-containing protein n=1 Tax=Candidatus Enterococcus murrayae TaxID=2815321 RepID=A0ABS3HN77_9ENTE|nr:non-ribosomal peptide synthetase [Enterococcus sp. MJM16]MBO0454911.1 amino acid adenylation domain-containing protein [Enterococcus sp. MJM16]
MERYKMSPNQKRIFTLVESQRDSTLYNIPSLYEVEKEMNTEKLQMALLKLIQRHESLRTRFEVVDDNFLQIIEDKPKLDFQKIDIDEISTDQIFKDFTKPFNIQATPLFRVKQIICKEKQYLFLDFHHLISDGESMVIIQSELMDLYNGKKLVKQSYQYKHYSSWINKYDKSKAEKFWLNEFLHWNQSEVIVPDFPRENANEVGKEISLILPTHISRQIREFCKKNSKSSQVFWLAAVVGFLKKIGDHEDITLGLPVMGRDRNEFMDIIGMFVNTTVIRNANSQKIKFLDLIDDLEMKLYKILDFQSYPFDQLVEISGNRFEKYRNSLFDIMFNYQKIWPSIPNHENMLCPVEMETTNSKFDLTINIVEKEDQIIIGFEYKTGLFKKERVSKMLEQFSTFVEKLLVNEKSYLANLDLLSEEEMKIITASNDTKRTCSEKSVVEIFEEKVQLRKNEIAIEYDQEKITYGELNLYVNGLAKILIEKGVKTGDRIILRFERSFEMIISILAVLKVKAVFVPIDPEHPIDRVEYIIKDCKAKLMLSNLVKENRKDIDEILVQKDAIKKTDNPSFHYSQNLSSYIIYTSGTTGSPKGVEIMNTGIVNLAEWLSNFGHFSYETEMLQNFNYVFDGSIFEIFAPLLFGAKLILMDDDSRKDPEKLLNLIQNRQIIMVPSMFRALIEYAIEMGEEEKLNGFEHIYLGGEPLSRDILDKYLASGGKCIHRISNCYGPTEGTVCVTAKNFKNWNNEEISIGKPIDNTEIYIIHNDSICNIGSPGEICISGAGLAIGYVNQPNLTEKKFVELPMLGTKRVYKTGDIGYWTQDGDIICQGRKDEQVKLRGYRIELGEIDSQIRKIDNVQDSISRIYQENDILVSYIVPKKNKKVALSEKDIKNQLKQTLPKYMIPNRIVFLDNYPMNASGKVNYKALKVPSMKIEEKSFRPLNIVEGVIAEVFEEVLSISRLKYDDDFFDLGGDSIKAIRVVSKLRIKGYSVKVFEILQNSKVFELAKVAKKVSRKFEQHEVIGHVEQSPIQKSFFEKKMKNPNHFNQSIVLESTENLNSRYLKIILKELTIHHDVFRSIFPNNKQEIKPLSSGVFYEFQKFEVPNKENFDSFVYDHSNQVQKSMDIESGPLLKGILFKSKGKNLFVVICHHLIIDGISWGIIVEDIETMYGQLSNGWQLSLPDKTSSVVEWSKSLLSYGESLNGTEEISFWRRENEKIIRPNQFKTNLYKKNKIQHIPMILNKNETHFLMREVTKFFGAELNHILLTALLTAIQQIGNLGSISLNLEGHGRDQISKNVSIDRTVGWFTTIYPLSIDELTGKIERDIHTVKKKYQLLSKKGIHYGLISKNDKSSSWKEPFITYNFNGETSTTSMKDSGQVFRENDISAGDNVDEGNMFSTGITVNGLIENGQLVVVVSTIQAEYFLKSAEELQSEFFKQIRKIISYVEDLNVNDVKEEFENHSKIVSDQVLKMFVPNKMQMFYLENSTFSFESIKFNTKKTVEDIFQIINNIVENQDVFRFVFNDTYKAMELRRLNPIFSPSFLDLSIVDDVSKTNDVENFKDYLIELVNSNEKSTFLSSIGLIRTCQYEYELLFYVHHAVWDKMSRFILEDNLINNLNDECRENLKDYYFYNQKIIEANYDNNRLIDTAKIFVESYRNGQADLFSKFENRMIQLELEDSSFSAIDSDPWKFVGKVLRKYLESSDQWDRKNHIVPMLFVYEDRRVFHKELTNTIGLFADILPFVLKLEEDDESVNIEELVGLKRKNKINYYELLSKITESQNDFLKKVPTVNFQIGYGTSKDEISQIFDDESNQENTSPQIIFTRYEDTLVIMYPDINVNRSKFKNAVKKITQEVK